MSKLCTFAVTSGCRHSLFLVQDMSLRVGKLDCSMCVLSQVYPSRTS